MQTQTQPIKLVRPGEGNHLWVLNIHQTQKLTGDDTNGGLFIWEDRVPPEAGPPPHIHHAEDELFYVLEGRVAFFREDGVAEGEPGTLVFIPRGTVHAFKNIGETEARLLVMMTPAGFERSDTAVGEPVADPAVAPHVTHEMIGRLLSAGPAHNIEFMVPA